MTVEMAGIFDIDLDQPDDAVSEDELEDGVSFHSQDLDDASRLACS